MPVKTWYSNAPNSATHVKATSNPQLIIEGMKHWKVTRFGHASKGQGNTRINNEIRSSLSRKRITVSLRYVPTIEGIGLLRLWNRKRKRK